MERVKVINPNESWRGTEYYIGGNKIENVKSVDFRVAVDEVPTFTFETYGAPNIDMPGEVRFSFTPQTIHDASVFLQHELSDKNSEFRKEFIASVASALKELPKECVLECVAEKIIDRIVGCE